MDPEIKWRYNVGDQVILAPELAGAEDIYLTPGKRYQVLEQRVMGRDFDTGVDIMCDDGKVRTILEDWLEYPTR